jgi:hypothetical protein
MLPATILITTDLVDSAARPASNPCRSSFIAATGRRKLMTGAYSKLLREIRLFPTRHVAAFTQSKAVQALLAIASLGSRTSTIVLHPCAYASLVPDTGISSAVVRVIIAAVSAISAAISASSRCDPALRHPCIEQCCRRPRTHMCSAGDRAPCRLIAGITRTSTAFESI